jgi:hypothetical protein
MERICDAAFGKRSVCFKVRLAVADVTYWRAMRMIPSFKKGTVLFFGSHLTERTCRLPRILDECQSPLCSEKKLQDAEQAENLLIWPKEPTPLRLGQMISTGEIDHNGVILSHTVHAPAVHELLAKCGGRPQSDDNPFLLRIVPQFDKIKASERCLKNAAVHRVPQCLKIQWTSAKETSEVPAWTMTRLVPSRPNACTWYEYLVNPNTCYFPEDSICLEGSHPDCPLSQMLLTA